MWGRKQERKRLDLESYDQALTALEARADELVRKVKRSVDDLNRARNEAERTIAQLRSRGRNSSGSWG